MKTKILFFIFFLTVISLHGQIKVNDSEDLVTIIKRLEGQGVKISNIKYRMSPNAAKRPAGSFIDPFGFTGLDKGLLLTTGAAVNALGPNNDPHKTQINDDDFQDPDLTPFIEDYDKYTNSMNDECYVEFDIVSAYPVLSFNYVFASEEYIETMEYHDVLAFIISGPGISGKKNMALVPNTSDPVSVASINPNVNSQYYLSNGDGSTPYINIDMQYDGYTTVLKAIAEVTPCETYHLKIAIADVLDDTYDAAVFIEEGSFASSNIDINVLYEHPRFNYSIEGCNDAFVIFKRSSQSSIQQDIKYELAIKGTATNGIDYSYLSDTTVLIPAGIDSTYITISPIKDGISDEGEFVRMVLFNSCTEFQDSNDSIDIPIHESFPYNIPDETICMGKSTILNKSFIPIDSIFWDSSPYLSCFKCSSPLANPDTLKYFSYLAKDTTSGCTARDSVKVEVIVVKADFDFFRDSCYTSLDLFFTNKSLNATSYYWDFGDNKNSMDPNPVHQYPYLNVKNNEQYIVSLTASRENPSCAVDTVIAVDINLPFFIPNLITRNKDGRNDNFNILGIAKHCWTLTIYNRWGERVYSKENYNNDFSGNNLSVGIYYYNFRNSLNDRNFNGWIEIIDE